MEGRGKEGMESNSLEFVHIWLKATNESTLLQYAIIS